MTPVSYAAPVSPTVSPTMIWDIQHKVRTYMHTYMAVAIDTNLLVALRAIDLLSTPTPSRDHMLPVSIFERYHN